MAQTIVGQLFAPGEGSYLPACHNEALADQPIVAGGPTALAVVDTKVVGLKWLRLRGVLKTLGGLVAGNLVQVSVQVGTGANLTGPVNLVQRLLRMETGDTAIFFDMIGGHPLAAGFQSYKIIVSTYTSPGVIVSTTATFDFVVDCA
jgi:hypothetical protein